MKTPDRIVVARPRPQRDQVFGNVLVSSRFESYLAIYEKYKTWPLDSFSDRPPKDDREPIEIGRQVLEGVYTEGRFPRPKRDE